MNLCQICFLCMDPTGMGVDIQGIKTIEPTFGLACNMDKQRSKRRSRDYRDLQL